MSGLADAPEGALVTTKKLNDVLGMDALILDDPGRLAEVRRREQTFRTENRFAV